MRKVLDIISVVSLVISLSLAGSATFGLYWLKSGKAESMIKDLVLKQVKVPNLPSSTGLAVPSQGKLPF